MHVLSLNSSTFKKKISLGLFILLLVILGGCPAAISDESKEIKYRLSHDDLLNPETCRGCHASHVEEWESSMHAYAGRDPVFLAMNTRGQRETNGALGDFCLRCHMPLAVSAGATAEGTALEDIDDKLKGVSCYFCHTVSGVNGEFNNPLIREDDDLMRGPIQDPLENDAHAMQFSALHDRKDALSSNMCGSCHDVMNGHGVLLEATFAEWKNTIYGRTDQKETLSCGDCHMKGRDAPIVGFADAPVRRMHSHLFAGVDVALEYDFPEKELQIAEIQRFLDTTLFAEVCVENSGGNTTIKVSLENFAAGHSFPSGASFDRRVWVEVTAKKGENVVYKSGAVDENERVRDVAETDPFFWELGAKVFAKGQKTHMFWEVDEKEDFVLLGAQGVSVLDPNYQDVHQSRVYSYIGLLPDEVSMAVHLRPIGKDVLDDLVESGDLASKWIERMPTFTLRSTELTWKKSSEKRCYPIGR